MRSNERLKAVSTMLFNLGSASLAAGMARIYFHQAFDPDAALWLILRDPSICGMADIGFACRGGNDMVIHLSREVADLVPAIGGAIVAAFGYWATRYTAKHSHDR